MTMNREFAKFLGWAYCSSIDNYSKEPLEEFVSKRESAEWEPCPDFTTPDGFALLHTAMREKGKWAKFYITIPRADRFNLQVYKGGEAMNKDDEEACMFTHDIIFVDDLDTDPDTIDSLRQEIARLTADRDDWRNICSEQALRAEQAEAERETITKHNQFLDKKLSKVEAETNGLMTIATLENETLKAERDRYLRRMETDMKTQRLEALVEYITNRKYLCLYCVTLQKNVILYGLAEVRNYTGMVCPCITDMKIRLQEAETGKLHESIDVSSLDEED